MIVQGNQAFFRQNIPFPDPHPSCAIIISCYLSNKTDFSSAEPHQADNFTSPVNQSYNAKCCCIEERIYPLFLDGTGNFSVLVSSIK